MKSKIIEKVRQREAKIAALRAREKFADMMAEINNQPPTGANPMIQAAMDAGKDATGLCTVRELVREMITGKKGDTCELAFPLLDGRRVNVEVRITKLEEVELS